MDINKLDIQLTQEPKYAEWLKEAYEYSKNSKHTGTHNAALLIDNDKIVLKGTNNLPPGVEEKKERFESPNKHTYLNHAERDVIYKAARQGIKTEGLTMVMPWTPCIPCANAVISAGIKLLILHKQMIERTEEHWFEELKNAIQIMKEAKVDVIAYDGILGVKGFMHDKEWDA